MTKKILIFEDEPKNRKLLRDLFERFGYETIVAADGEQGIELIMARKPDLILMDIMMPKIDGLRAARLIKTNSATKNIPVLALTAYAMSGDREHALEAGCNEYITKPFDINGLLKTVGQYLSG